MNPSSGWDILDLMRVAIGGVGSDLDVVLIVSESDLPFEGRASKWDLTVLPVPVDVLVYTQGEWERMTQQLGFGKRMAMRLDGLGRLRVRMIIFFFFFS